MDNNQVFSVTRELYGDTSVTYNNIKLIASNRFDLGTGLSFNWGDTGPGAEALAFAILNKVGSKEIANRYTKLYTKNVISKIKRDDWTLNAIDVLQWINENIDNATNLRALNDRRVSQEEIKEEDRRKKERRVKRETDFQAEAQKRLKEHLAKQEERRLEEKRFKEERISAEKDFQEESRKTLKDIEEQFQEELAEYTEQIEQQKVDIQTYQAQIKKYKLFIESLDINSIYAKYSNLEK